MTLVKNKLAVAVAIALSTSLGLVGCGDDKSVSTAVGVPNPNTLMPTGTVQGVLRDTVTNEPIVGAIVDIGIAQAVTSETGQFIIKDVPATGSIGAAAADGNAPYKVTIDLRNVKQAAGAAKYPSFSFAEAAVTYSSLNDGSNDAGTSSSNHDTPVTGLVAPLELKVGKLAAGIKGTVAKAMDFKAVGAGYTVKLVSKGSLNSTTGNNGGTQKFLDGNVVATATTDASGAFAFSGIESLRDFVIEVVNADGTEYGVEEVKSPADGQVKTLLAQRALNDDIQDLRTVFVDSTDTLAPKLVKTTPETGTERAPGANVTVTFSFSEPIVSNGLTNSLTAPTPDKEGLYDLVSVKFTGIKDIAMKAGNIPYSLAWDATRTQLTVIIPKVKASANYEVSIAGAEGILKDNHLKPLNLAAGEGVVKFSTSAEGAAKPVAPVLAITNEADLNLANNAVVDWLPVAGAKGYHVYRAKFVNDVMDSKGYQPVSRTMVDEAAANAATTLEQAKTAAQGAQMAVATAKTAATAATKASADAAKNANVADVAANAAVQKTVEPTNAVKTSTDAASKLTAPAATDSRAADKVAELAKISDDASTSAVTVTLKTSIDKLAGSAKDSNKQTALVAQKKVQEVVNTIAAATSAENTGAKVASDVNEADTAVRKINQDIMVAAKVAAAVDAIVEVASKVAAVSAPSFATAEANVAAAQAAVDADPTQAKQAALTAANIALEKAKQAAVDYVKAQAEAAQEAAKKAQDALEVVKKAAADTKQAQTDAYTAKTKADEAKTKADEAKTKAKTKADEAKTDADKALADAKKADTALTKANTDLATAKSDLAKADTEAEAEDAAKDLVKALAAVAKADTAADNARIAANNAAAKAIAADVAADEAAEKAADAADAADVATAAATAATTAATKATQAVADITAAVQAADAAADALDTATANAKPSDVQAMVLKSEKAWKAKTATALAKANAASSIMNAVAIKEDAKKATDAAKKADDKATKVAESAKVIAAQAAAAQTAVAVAQVQAANALVTANKNDADATQALKDAEAAKKKAESDVTAQEKKLTDAQTLVATTTAAETTAQTTATNAAAALAADPTNVAKKAAADAAAAALNTATLAKNSAISAEALLSASQSAVLTKLNAIVAAKIKAEGFAKIAAAAAASAADDAKTAKEDADAALTAANTAKAAAATALTDANKAKTATAKLLASMTAAEASIKTAVGNYTDAKNATADALTASTTAADAADKLVEAAAKKADADKTLATKVKEQAAADKALADAQGVVDSKGGYVDNTNMDQYLTQNTSFVQGSEGNPAKPLDFAEGIRKITYKYKVRAVTEDNAESVDSNEVEAKDNTAPKVSSFTMNTASDVITVVFTEPMNELDFKNQANYVLSAPTGVTVPALLNASFKIDSKTVVLTYNANIPAGSTVTVTGVKDLAGNTMSVVGNSATVDKVTSSIAGFVGSTQVTVFFSADMNKVSAENAANYVLSSGLALLAENGVVYDAANNSVTLTYVSAIPAGVTLTVSGVTDANGTVVDSNTKTFN